MCWTWGLFWAVVEDSIDMERDEDEGRDCCSELVPIAAVVVVLVAVGCGRRFLLSSLK